MAAFCAKSTYSRGVGAPVSECASGLTEDAWLCYKPCKSGFHGVGPVCWQNCPPGKVACGAGCAGSGTECATTTANMVWAPAKLALVVFTMGSSSKIEKAYTGIKKLAMDVVKVAKDAYQVAEPAILLYTVGSAGYELGESVGVWVADYVKPDAFERFTTTSVGSEVANRFSAEAADWVRRQYALNHLGLLMEADGMGFAKGVLGVVSAAGKVAKFAELVDPTGVTGVVTGAIDVAKAYTQPVCDLDEPFPAVTPAY